MPTLQARLVRISASDRDVSRPGESNSAFSIPVPSSSPQFRAIQSLTVVSVTMPNVFYNVPARNAESGQTLRWIHSGGQVEEVNIFQGQYTIEQLLTLVAEKLEEEGGTTITWEVDLIAYIVILTSSTNEFAIDPTCQVAKLLGFQNEDGVPNDEGLIQVGNWMPNLQGIEAVYIHCPQICSPGTTDFQDGLEIHSFITVPMDVPFTQTAFYSPGTSCATLQQYNARHFGEFNFLLRDSNGILLNIQDHDWTIVMKIAYYI